MLRHFDQPRNIVQVVKRYILSPNTTRTEIGRDAVSRPPCGPKALGSRHKSRSQRRHNAQPCMLVEISCAASVSGTSLYMVKNAEPPIFSA